MSDKIELVTLSQVSEELGHTKVSITRWIKLGLFPDYDVKINARVKRWNRETLNKFYSGNLPINNQKEKKK
jgi:hypothetical protein